MKLLKEFRFLALLASSSRGATFSGLGDLNGGTFESGAYDVSADGSVVVGFSRSGSGAEAFRWTPQSAMAALGDLDGGTFESFAWGISGDGLTIVGSGAGASGREAFRWTTSTGLLGIGDLPGGTFESEAFATSADGRVTVGVGNTTLSQQNNSTVQEATRWGLSGSILYGGMLLLHRHRIASVHRP